MGEQKVTTERTETTVDVAHCGRHWPESYRLNLSSCILEEGHDGACAFFGLLTHYAPSGGLERSAPMVVTLGELDGCGKPAGVGGEVADDH